LVMSLAQNPSIKTWVHLDERSAAYFALGISRALSEPVAIVSTSGTAAANFFPAVIEAHYAHIPILIMTADRPPELWEWGANQTIDQTRLYGIHAKWSVNMASPEITPDLLRYVREMACRAIKTAVQPPAGAVHINFPFREPLVPQIIPADISEHVFAEPREAWHGRKQGSVYTAVRIGRRSLSQEQVEQVGADLRGVSRGIIVCGPQDDPDFPISVSLLASRLGFPILADPLSQVRCGTHDRGMVVDCYDAFLHSDKLVQALEPEIILRFGATPTSKVLSSYIEQQHHARQIFVQEEDWQDPFHVATDMFQTEPNRFARDLAGAVAVAPDRDWAERWLAVAETSRTAIRDQLSRGEEIFEGRIFTELAALFLFKGVLFVGNSMPVRDLDTFYPSTSQQIRFLANRGASGIDGVVSTALGSSAVRPDPTVIVIGDMSFYHDMNGLLAAKQYQINATIIVVNNNGGGIFSFLPQRRYEETFETYFGTPHGLTFEATASLYSLGYSKIASWSEFRKVVQRNIERSATAIVEVPTDREENVELHRRTWSAVVEAAESVVMERT
jgi:2-succinyl-5-enolpyruvyl-6-hydroxy-3-cyclohexene-1-carboxylate synthase